LVSKSSPTPILEYDPVSRSWQPGCRTLVREIPLEIRVNGAFLTILHRSPGSEERLAAGFLFYQGLIAEGGEITACRFIPGNRDADRILAPDRLEITLQGNHDKDVRRLSATAIWSAITPAGDRPKAKPFALSPELIPELPERLFAHQQLYEATAGAHAVALLDAAGRILHCEEDVGRTNALDKIVGYCLEKDLARDAMAALFSGRINLEMAVKIARAGFPLALSLSAPTAPAVEILKQAGLTYIGSLQKRPLTLFCGQLQ